MFALALTQTALAAGNWWGAGPVIGTMLLPIEYPVGFPSGVNNKTTDEPRVAFVRGDLEIGGKGVIYMGGGNRFGGRLLLGTNFGSWNRQQFTLEYDQVLMKDEKLQFLGGGGVGIGHQKFSAEDDEYPYLDVTFFPIRGQLEGLYRDRTRAYSITIYGTLDIAGEQSFCAKASKDCVAPSDVSEDDGLFAGAALYAGLGVEATVYFGNFKKKDNENDGGGKRKNRKNNKG
jgi:hypothetical protein